MKMFNSIILGLFAVSLSEEIGAFSMGANHLSQQQTSPFYSDLKSMEYSHSYGMNSRERSPNMMSPYYYAANRSPISLYYAPNPPQQSQSTSQFFSPNVYFNPMMTSDSVTVPVAVAIPQNSAHKESQIQSSLGSMNSEHDHQQQHPLKQQHQQQQSKQSIIFGRGFTGYDGGLYIPVFYPVQWNYDQYPSAAGINSAYQASSPSAAWSWASTPTMMNYGRQPQRFSAQNQFYTEPAKFSSSVQNSLSQLKRSEHRPMLRSAMEEYFASQREHPQQLPRAIIGDIQSDNNFIVAPVFKLQDDFPSSQAETKQDNTIQEDYSRVEEQREHQKLQQHPQQHSQQMTTPGDTTKTIRQKPTMMLLMNDGAELNKETLFSSGSSSSGSSGPSPHPAVFGRRIISESLSPAMTTIDNINNGRRVESESQIESRSSNDAHSHFSHLGVINLGAESKRSLSQTDNNLSVDNDNNNNNNNKSSVSTEKKIPFIVRKLKIFDLTHHQSSESNFPQQEKSQISHG